MTRSTFDEFSLDLPDGWGDLADDGTYSDPTEGQRKMFARPGCCGVLYVALLPLDGDNPPSDDPDHLLALAGAWGRARGLKAPLSLTSAPHPDGTLACAEYKLAADYVAVWYLSDGQSTLHASYVSSWKARDQDRAPRDAIIASLEF